MKSGRPGGTGARLLHVPTRRTHCNVICVQAGLGKDREGRWAERRGRGSGRARVGKREYLAAVRSPLSENGKDRQCHRDRPLQRASAASIVKR